MKDGVSGGLLRDELAKADGLVGQLNVLLAHRLHPFFDLLEARALISPDLARIASAHVSASSPVPEMQVEEECRVLSRLVADQVQALVIKGTALAATIYEHLHSRVRTDMDILVSPSNLESARQALQQLDYQPTWAEPSAVPLKQEQWSRRVVEKSHSVDLHWDLRNHPVFYGVLEFDELVADSTEIPSLGAGVRGLGYPHALLLSVMHWYANAPDERALIWLLDSELLWNGMDDTARELTLKLAAERGLSGLLGDHLKLCCDWLASPIEQDVLNRLIHEGESMKATRLIRASQSGGHLFWFDLFTEPGWDARIQRIRQIVLPSREYMYQIYPEGSNLGLLGLHLRRIVRIVTAGIQSRLLLVRKGLSQK